MVDDVASAWSTVGTRGGVWPKAGSPGAAAVVVEGFGELRVCVHSRAPWLLAALPSDSPSLWPRVGTSYCHRWVWSQVPACVPRALGTSAKATQRV